MGARSQPDRPRSSVAAGTPGAQRGMDDLPRPLRTSEITELVLAQVDERHVIRQLVDGESFGRRRHEDLSSMRSVHHPGRPGRCEPEIVAVVVRRSPTGVDTHSHRDPPDRLLGLDRGPERVAGMFERCHHAIAGVLDDHTSARANGSSQLLVVIGQGRPHSLGVGSHSTLLPSMS